MKKIIKKFNIIILVLILVFPSKSYCSDKIYNSKEELFIEFYFLFYQYILSEGGGEFLQAYDINNLNDFLLLHKTWTGGATGFRLVGALTEHYFLTQDVGGNILNQKDKEGFIGFCLKNNKFVDFILYLQEFFYYFRLDEGYTDFNNSRRNGSDFLADPFASAIDTAKFFYYDKDTLPLVFYQKGSRVPEMYDRIPNIRSS